MDLTVCICTHNRTQYVRDCLDGLWRQTVGRDRFAVLVIDSGSTGSARVDLANLIGAFDGVRLIRLDQPGLSAARNAGAWAARTPYIAYIDDDAIPACDWVERILVALWDKPRGVALIGGRILPRWEAPLPQWWPASLRGVLSIIEHEGAGEYRTRELPRGLEPYGANMIVHVLSLLSIGGFHTGIGRRGGVLLSDEDVQVAWKLQDNGHSVRYDSTIVVEHQIAARRLTPAWLLSRLYWQGASTVITRCMLGQARSVWRELPRRLVVAALCAPFGFIPARSSRCIAARWRLAYASGFITAAFGRTASGAAASAPSHVAVPKPAMLTVVEPV